MSHRQEFDPMCAFAAAFDFGAEMIKLSAATFGRLIEIQLEDLAAFVAHQSASVDRVAAVDDVTGLLALQREYQNTFWNDRLNAFVAARKTLQVAMENMGQRLRRWTTEDRPTPPSAPILEQPKPRSAATRARKSVTPGKTPKAKTRRTRAAKKGEP